MDGSGDLAEGGAAPGAHPTATRSPGMPWPRPSRAAWSASLGRSKRFEMTEVGDDELVPWSSER